MAKKQNPLLNKRSLRVLLRDVPFELIDSLEIDFNNALNELREKHQEDILKAKERQNDLERIAQELKDKGYSTEEVANIFNRRAKSERKQSIVAPKYEYLTKSGELKQWTGRGRTPVEIKEAISNGSSLEQFLIKTNNI